MAAPRQAPVTFEDVVVRFSAEEWELLEEWQRELHREVTEGTSLLLASLGPPSSPALSALVQLVKGIPEFLFGGPKAGAEPGAASGGDTAAGGVAAEQGCPRDQPPCPRDEPPGSPQPPWSWAALGAGGWQSLAVEPGTACAAAGTEVPAEPSPLRSLEKCLEELAGRGSGPPSPPAGGSCTPEERQRGEPGGRQALPGRCSLRGATAPAAPPRSPAGTRALGARGTAVPGDARDASGTRPPVCPPAAATATKRPVVEAGPASATSAAGSGTCPGGCGGPSSPKKRHPGPSPPAPWEPPGEARDPPQVEVGRVGTVLAEELERLCRELGSVRRVLWGVRSRLERGWAREPAALRHGRRCLRHAIRRLAGGCWAREARCWRSLPLLGLPDGAEGAGAIASLQTTLPAVPGLLPAPAPPQIESARRLHGLAALARPLLVSLLCLADKPALPRAAHQHPEPPTRAGARLAIVPAACPHGCGDTLAAGRWAWRVAEPGCGTPCPAAGRGWGAVGP